MIQIPKPGRRAVAGLATFAALIACVPAYVSGYTVSGPSEAPTLLLGDFVIVARETLGAAKFSHEITYTPGLSPLRSFAPVTVAEDCDFLLGDHRDNSNDSRTFGPVARSQILGRVVSVWGREAPPIQ